MRYLCLIYLNERDLSALPEKEASDLNARHLDLNEDLLADGHFIEAEALEAAASTTCVRVRNGRAAVTDGPFAETKEQVAGFYFIEARDLNEAIQVASRIPSVTMGTIEVRPCRDLVVEGRPRKASSKTGPLTANRKEILMPRFVVMVKATKSSEAGALPTEQLIADMTTFNEQLVKAGIMEAGEGLQPSSKGARVKFSKDNKRTVVDGPFPETKELVAGYWIWKCKSQQEAIDWVKRCPQPMPGEESEIEIRQIMAFEDFGAEFTPELQEREAKLRREAAAR